LNDDFSEFLRDRADLLVAAMYALTEGLNPTLDTLWANHLANKVEQPESVA
jgi:hypothetical protein